jgi:glycosyltransferase involved in cell wall biosynthesis
MRIAFYSTMEGMTWGGSEELWSRAAAVLLRRGHQVCVNYGRRKQPVPPLERLADAGAEIHRRRRPLYGRSVRQLLDRLRLGNRPLRAWLQQARPDLCVVSIGFHIDNVGVARVCQELGVPYALVLQAASPYLWYNPSQWEQHHTAYSGAAASYFLSAQNRDTMEANLGLDLSAARIIDNPFNVPTDAAPAWPADGDVWKLACVARLQFSAKGQDLILQALRQPKWRDRAIEITLYGEDGGSRAYIERLIELYGLGRHVKLGGFVSDVQDIWRRNHALVLPSRFEGNPLALIEAMLCGRPAIVTNVGRAAELIDDNTSGFLAAAPMVELVDDALERAWQRRHEWQAIGARAATAIRQRHSLQPAEDFADALLGAAAGQRVELARAA